MSEHMYITNEQQGTTYVLFSKRKLQNVSLGGSYPRVDLSQEDQRKLREEILPRIHKLLEGIDKETKRRREENGGEGFLP